MYDGWPLAQIAEAAPKARILVMLRDPVDRYASGYARENRLARERGEEGISPAMVEEQRVRGFYAGQVERVLETFPRERVLILQYERCRDGVRARAGAHLRLPGPRHRIPARGTAQRARRAAQARHLGGRAGAARARVRGGRGAPGRDRPRGRPGSLAECARPALGAAAADPLGSLTERICPAPQTACWATWTLRRRRRRRTPAACRAPRSRARPHAPRPATTASTVVETAQVDPTRRAPGRRARHRDVEGRVLHGAVVRGRGAAVVAVGDAQRQPQP